jgi:hypothetical protein
MIGVSSSANDEEDINNMAGAININLFIISIG